MMRYTVLSYDGRISTYEHGILLDNKLDQYCASNYGTSCVVSPCVGLPSKLDFPEARSSEAKFNRARCWVQTGTSRSAPLHLVATF